MTHADDGFGNMVSLNNPYGEFTRVYQRKGNETAQYEVGTGDIQDAIAIVRQANPRCGAALVLVPSKKPLTVLF